MIDNEIFINNLEGNKLVDLKDQIEDEISSKIAAKVLQKKNEIMSDLTGVPVEVTPEPEADLEPEIEPEADLEPTED